MVGLGTAVPEETEARALDVSSEGSVIVGSLVLGDVFSGGELVAMIWDPINGQRVLQDVLAPDVDLTGWVLMQATGVSDDGLTIVGTGRNPQGVTEGWVVVIPEPSTTLLLALGLVGLAHVRRAAIRRA